MIVSMKCWICAENEAATREHRIKRTDLDLHAGPVSPDRPLFRKPDGERPLRIASSRATALAFEKTVCNRCNSHTTQTHDRAWEQLSRYLYDHESALSRRNRVWLQDVFGAHYPEYGVRVHLYFLKIFGCKCLDAGVEIDLKTIAANITGGSPSLALFLAFGLMPPLQPGERFALETPIFVLQHEADGRIAAVLSFYVVGRIAVQLFYFPYFRPPQSGLWNPSAGSSVLRLRHYPAKTELEDTLINDARRCVQEKF